jgi:hypothetical protein
LAAAGDVDALRRLVAELLRRGMDRAAVLAVARFLIKNLKRPKSLEGIPEAIIQRAKEAIDRAWARNVRRILGERGYYFLRTVASVGRTAVKNGFPCWLGRAASCPRRARGYEP